MVLTGWCLVSFLVGFQIAVYDTAKVNLKLMQPSQEIRPSSDVLLYPDDHTMQKDQAGLDRGSQASVPGILSPTPCANNLTFCEDKDDYPRDLVLNAVRNQPKAFMQFFFSEDEYDVDDNTDRFNIPPVNEHSLCSSSPKIMYPTKAQSKEGFLEFIVNEGSFKQGIKVETCMNEDRPCNIPGTLSEGYTSHCEQRNVVRTLVVLNKNTSDPSGIITKPFEFPSCCVCSIIFDGPGHDRFGGSLFSQSQPKSNSTKFVKG